MLAGDEREQSDLEPEAPVLTAGQQEAERKKEARREREREQNRLRMRRKYRSEDIGALQASGAI